jgi:hypothetical protein
VILGSYELLAHERVDGHVVGCRTYKSSGGRNRVTYYIPKVQIKLNKKKRNFETTEELERFYKLGESVQVVVNEDYSSVRIFSLTGFWITGIRQAWYPIGFLILYSFVYSVMSKGEYIILRIGKSITVRKLKQRKKPKQKKK